MVLEILDFFSLMILVVFLNHTKLRHTISGRAYILLKGALILFCFRFFLMLVGNTIRVIYANDKAKNITMLLLLPFVKKITELLWGKIFFDEKCIIGELRRNRDTNLLSFKSIVIYYFSVFTGLSKDRFFITELPPVVNFIGLQL